jgi:hypothetical protein
MGPTQELAQNVCQRYGWSCLIAPRREDGRWTCSVRVGAHDTRVFVSACTDPDTKEGRKQGVAAASAAALDGLKDVIESQESKPVKELSAVFTRPIDVYESNNENWDYFWKHKPAVVGIDVEGNQVSPPVLVQVSVDDYTILEAPRNGKISIHLTRLLRDEGVVKVFCDNFAHKDKLCLGIDREQIPSDLTRGHLVDLEAIAAQLLGPVKVARGLSRIVVLSMPELGAVIRKPNSKGRFKNVGRFILIEQGKKPPLKSIHELTAKEVQYAALDSWCTLTAYKRFRGS